MARTTSRRRRGARGSVSTALATVLAVGLTANAGYAFALRDHLTGVVDKHAAHAPVQDPRTAEAIDRYALGEVIAGREFTAGLQALRDTAPLPSCVSRGHWVVIPGVSADIAALCEQSIDAVREDRAQAWLDDAVTAASMACSEEPSERRVSRAWMPAIAEEGHDYVADYRALRSAVVERCR